MSTCPRTFGGLFKAKLRDNGIDYSEDDYKSFCSQLDRGYPTGIINLSGQRIGINVLTKLTKVMRTSPHIRVFHFYGNLIRDHGIHSLFQLLIANSRVTVVDIGCNDLTDRSLPCILDIIKTTHVDSLQLGTMTNGWHLNKFSIYSISEVIGAVKACNRFRCLGLSGLHMSEGRGAHRHSIADVLADFVANDPTISSISIADTGFSLREEDIVTAQGLLLNDRLRFLDLRGHNFADPVGPNFLSQLNQMAKLTYLDLHSCHLSPAAGKALAENMQLPNKISVLLLADNSLGDEGVIELLNVLMDKETLVELDVSLNHFEEATAEVIGQFIGTNKVIYRLNISKNIIGDNGAQLISSRLEQNGSLASLDLSSCRIADPGAIGIARALRRNTALTTLRISDNFLTRECGYVMVENIRHNEHIQKIDVSATQIDHFVIQALVALCKRNRQIEKEIGLQPLKKEVIQLSIQRTKMPEAESRLAVLEEHRNELEEEVGSLDEDLDNTQNTATANILQIRKQIQTAEEGIVEEQEQIVKIEADNEKMVQEFEERYQEIVGTQEKERQLIKRYDEQALEIDALIQHNVDATTAEAGELQSQIDQIRELLSRTTEVSFDPEALRIYEKPELPEFMLVPKSNLFLNDDIMDLREQEKKKRKKKGRKKSPKGKKKKSSPSLPQLEPTAEGVESTPPPPEPVLAAPAPASQSPGGKRGESARRKSPLKKGKL